MRSFLANLSWWQWLIVLAWSIYGVGKLLEWIGRSRPARSAVNWPKRSAAHSRPPIPRSIPRQRQIRELELEGPSASTVQDLRRLFIVTTHDKAKVNRLIEYEMRRAPGISRDEAISRAYQRWVDDNR